MWDFRVGAAFWSAETDSFHRLFLQDEDKGEGLSASAQL
jgi:hypothetical protein